MSFANHIRIGIDIFGIIAAVIAIGCLVVAKITKREKIYRAWEISRFVPMAAMAFNLFFR